VESMTTELEPQERKRLWFELGLVAALSLGQASVYAIVRLADIATRGPTREAQAKLNPPRSPPPGLDRVSQPRPIATPRLPVAPIAPPAHRSATLEPRSTPPCPLGPVSTSSLSSSTSPSHSCRSRWPSTCSHATTIRAA